MGQVRIGLWSGVGILFFTSLVAKNSPSRGDDVLQRRGELLRLMYNSWALSKVKDAKSSNYMASLDNLDSKTAAILKTFYREIAIDPGPKSYPEVLKLTHEKIETLFADLQKKKFFSKPEDVATFRKNLQPFYQTIRSSLYNRIAEDPLYAPVVNQIELNNYVEANAKNNDQIKNYTIESTTAETVWPSLMHDPHSEMLFRMIDGTYLLFESSKRLEAALLRRQEAPTFVDKDSAPAPFQNHGPLRRTITDP